MSLGRHADPVSLGQQAEHRRHDQRARDTAYRQHQLLFPRGGAEQVTAFQILQVVAADGGGATHDRTDHDGGHRTDR